MFVSNTTHSNEIFSPLTSHLSPLTSIAILLLVSIFSGCETERISEIEISDQIDQKLQNRTTEGFNLIEQSPTYNENGWLVFADHTHYESFQDELFQSLNGLSDPDQLEFIDDLYFGISPSFVSHFDQIREFIYNDSNLNIEIPENLDIGVESPSFTSLISELGVVQVASELFVFRGKKHVYKVHIDYASDYVASLSADIGASFPVHEPMQFDGVYIDEPNYYSFSSTGGPTEACPNCPDYPDGPVGPADVDDCRFELFAYGTDCTGPNTGRAFGGIEVTNGSFIGEAHIFNSNGEFVQTNSPIEASYDGSLNNQNNVRSHAHGGADILPGLYSVQIVGVFTCFSNGSTTEIDYTIPNIVVGGFCGGNRKTIRTVWDVFGDDVDDLFQVGATVRTHLSLEIFYSGVRAKCQARSNVTMFNTHYWAPLSSTFRFHQYSQWREDNSSCEKRDEDDEQEVMTGYSFGAALNSTWKDDRFWKSGEQWVTLTTHGNGMAYEGSGSLFLLHDTCE